MRIFQLCSTGAALLAAAGMQTGAQTAPAPAGRWDFNQGDLRATVGANMQFFGPVAARTIFESTVINGAVGHVMRFPAAGPSEGYLLFHGAQPNGGGTNVNVYTLVLDLFWPAESDGTFRALFNTDTNNLQDAVMFVNPDNQVGVNNDYSGELPPETWNRLALVFDLPNGTITKYVNGQTNETSVQFLGGNAVDSRFSLRPALLLFTDDDGETRTGLVDRVVFYAEALTPEQVVALGLPTGDGGPPVSGDVRIDSIQKVGFEILISASGGGTLQLQRKASLSDTVWQPAGQVNNSGTFTVPAGDPRGYFRVQRL